MTHWQDEAIKFLKSKAEEFSGGDSGEVKKANAYLEAAHAIADNYLVVLEVETDFLKRQVRATAPVTEEGIGRE